ncbi:MAG: hypothetical protein FWE08_01410 [Oscillospiraceae bacterium]|nr:hypothetical protein [Oscillospiraceae bacterium]
MDVRVILIPWAVVAAVALLAVAIAVFFVVYALRKRGRQAAVDVIVERDPWGDAVSERLAAVETSLTVEKVLSEESEVAPEGEVSLEEEVLLEEVEPEEQVEPEETENPSV